MKKHYRTPLSMLLAFMLTLSLCVPVFAASKAAIDSAVNGAAAYMLKTVTNPEVGSIGGEWAVIGLSRSGYNVPQSYYETYYRNVEQYVKNRKGILDSVKYTEYSRVILGLTAAGYDPTDIAGYDLTAPLEDYDKTLAQGINGPIWALIALDSANYENSIRDRYIAEILRRQTSDGGWNLSAGTYGAVGANEKGDTDTTGMALQALANYQHRQDVKAATDKAVTFLSSIQDASGGYSSWGEKNSESVVQVIVALTSLGISVDDTRFFKNGNTLVDNLLSFKNADGSFKHTADGTGVDQMSTEQALYALVAVQRAADGKTTLYDMTDVAVNPGTPPDKPGEGLPGKHADVQSLPVISPGRTFSDVKGHENQTAIEALASRGIINGKSADAFDPDATMTRAEFATITTQGLGLPDKIVTVFTDVPSTAWYAVKVGTAYFYGIVAGTSATTFNPNGTITRQEAAVMVARAAKLAGIDTAQSEAQIRDTLAPFGDYRTVASWAAESLAFCYSTGILDDTEFDIGPAISIKRCEIAEMLYRMLDMAKLL